MPEFLIILFVVGTFLGVFFLVSATRDRELLRKDKDREENPHDKRAA
jgi:hypothetical protein